VEPSEQPSEKEKKQSKSEPAPAPKTGLGTFMGKDKSQNKKKGYPLEAKKKTEAKRGGRWKEKPYEEGAAQ